MTLAVGLVGAGPWAAGVHGPTIAGHPHTRLAGVWSYQELLERCDAVAFAVPPGVQAELAIQAARAGRALLEKPIALDLDGARRLVDAVEGSGTASVVNLTWRYTAAAEASLTDAGSTHAPGG